MKIITTIIIISLLLFSIGCDTELGHSYEHEDHDHDGDGIQDHAPEDHLDEHIIEHQKNLVKAINS